MIRSKMMLLAFGALSLTGVSAMAATKTSHHQTKTNTPAMVAQAEGADSAKPADEGKAETKAETKKAKKSKSSKSSTKAKAAGGEAAPAPAAETK